MVVSTDFQQNIKVHWKSCGWDAYHGCEVWTMKEEEKYKLHVMEMDYMRSAIEDGLNMKWWNVKESRCERNNNRKGENEGIKIAWAHNMNRRWYVD